jgi:hypothetical protein
MTPAANINTEPKFPGDRGFAHWEPTSTSYGTKVVIHQSSNAAGPSLWLKLTQPDPLNGSPPELPASETSAHLFLGEAIEILEKLAAGIRYVHPGTPLEPGGMHPVDRALAFYDLTVTERNKAWHDLETLEKRIAKALEFAEDGDLKATLFQLNGEKR